MRHERIQAWTHAANARRSRRCLNINHADARQGAQASQGQPRRRLARAPCMHVFVCACMRAKDGGAKEGLTSGGNSREIPA